MEKLSIALQKSGKWRDINPENLKKQLNRPTTSSGLLQQYLLSISQNEEVKEKDIIIPCFYKTGLFDGKINFDFMLEISKAVTKLVKKN